MSILFLPVGVQAIGLADLTITPTRSVGPIETETATLAATNTPAPTRAPTPTAESQDIEVPWYSTPLTSTDLATDQSLAILAGRLIFHGLVDASSFCNGSSGLLSNGYASVCGEQAAHNAVINWQNQYDQAIFDAAARYEVPPYLLKNLIAQESQFWPARHLTIYNYYEYGLGHITQMGADTLLRWNDAYSRSFCREVFTPETCKTAYAWMPVTQRDMLRGSVLQTLDANCETCQGGADLARANASIPTIAATLKANYNHLEWVLGGITTGDPTRTFDASFMWRLTLAGYNAGPGCITTAIHQTNNLGVKLTWKNISAQFDKGCAGAVEYVERVTSNPRRADSQMLAYALADNSPATHLVFTNLGIQTPTQAAPSVTATVEITPTPTVESGSPTLQSTPTGILPVETSTPTVSTAAGLTSTPLTPEETPTGALPTGTSDQLVSATPELTPDFQTPEIIPTGTLQTETASPTLSPTPEFTPTPEDIEVQLQAPHANNQLLVKINPLNRGAALKTFLELGLSLPSDSENIDNIDTVIVNVEPENLDATLEALKASSGVEFAEPNYLAQLASLPNDPYFPFQTSLVEMQVPQAWDSLHSLKEVVVAVVDTGVDATHPDLTERIWVNGDEMGLDTNGQDKRSNGIDDDGNGYVDDWQGWNTVNANNDTSDDQGHGTHLAGIIGASVNNAIGISGVAPNARILPVKVLDNTGFGTYAQVAEGIIYATNMGARIINLGFGGTGSSETLQNAVDYAVAHGVLVVAASGNGGMDASYYPAAYPGVVAVSALSDGLNWAAFSSFGDHISLSAPGVGIYSTTHGGYIRLSGSSQASANVSGVAALLASQMQFADVDAIRSALLGSALDLGAPGRDQYFGYGSVRAYDALGYLGPVLPTPTPWAVPTSNSSGVYAQTSEELWATGQLTWSGATDSNLGNSIDSAFNGVVASSYGDYGGFGDRAWVFNNFQLATDPNSGPITSARLDFRYYIPPSVDPTDNTLGYVNDTYLIQVREPRTDGGTTPGCASGWCTVWTLANPASTLTTLPIDVFSFLNTRDRVNAAQVRIVGSGLTGPDGVDTVTIYVDEVRLTITNDAPTPIPPTPTAVLTPVLPTRVPTATPLANEPHNNFSANTDLCASCHRTHSSLSANSLASQNTEKSLCLTCHTASGPGTNIQTALNATTNTATKFYSHPVSAAPNVHTANEAGGSIFGGIFRHVECTDCHAPHNSAYSAASTTNPAPAIQQEMYGVSGVDPTYNSAGIPSGGFDWKLLPTAEREYQVCFKCHSSYTTLPTYAPLGLKKLTSASPQINDSRDLAKEFNPYQPSFHPLTALGRNRNISSDSFVSGWSGDSMVTCTDCHTNGNGPHGSPNLHMLDSVTGVTATNTGSQVCYKCHQFGTYNSGANPPTTTHFRKNAENLHQFHTSKFIACYTCHDTHGSEQSRLINFDISQFPLTSGNSQSAWNINPSNGLGSCAVGCHQNNPDPTFYYYTP